jgi:hypothetical protein
MGNYKKVFLMCSMILGLCCGVYADEMPTYPTNGIFENNTGEKITIVYYLFCSSSVQPTQWKSAEREITLDNGATQLDALVCPVGYMYPSFAVEQIQTNSAVYSILGGQNYGFFGFKFEEANGGIVTTNILYSAADKPIGEK